MMMQEDEFGHEGYDGDDSPGRYGRQDEIREEGNRRAYGLYGRQEDRSGQEVRRGQEDLVEVRRVQVHGTQVLGEGSRAREAHPQACRVQVGEGRQGRDMEGTFSKNFSASSTVIFNTS